MQPHLQQFQLSEKLLDLNITSTSTDYTVVAEDDVVLCTNTITITLPEITSITVGFNVHVKNNGTGTITIQSNGSETIDGAVQAELTVQYNSFYLITDGANWFII